MPHSVCPWWVGYLLLTPLRRFAHDPRKIAGPYVRAGMTVLEPGPGMGFFTLDLARMVGESGRVIAPDVQPKMLERLRRRAAKAGLLPRIDVRLAQPGSLGISDLAGSVDFELAFAVVHEMPAADSFFRESYEALKPGARLLLSEPSGHVKPAEFEAELAAAARAGLEIESRPEIRRSQSVVLRKPLPPGS